VARARDYEMEVTTGDARRVLWANGTLLPGRIACPCPRCEEPHRIRLVAEQCHVPKVSVECRDSEEADVLGKAYFQPGAASSGTVVIRKGACVTSVLLLHELAHAARPTHPHHRLAFIRTWIELLRRFESQPCAETVRGRLLDEGVRGL
jgi:hypothetical protein